MLLYIVGEISHFSEDPMTQGKKKCVPSHGRNTVSEKFFE